MNQLGLQSFEFKRLLSWMNLPMPKPDKTKIDKWNFSDFGKHTVESEAFTSLDELPEAVKALLILKISRILYIQRNNTPAYISAI